MLCYEYEKLEVLDPLHIEGEASEDHEMTKM